MFSQTPINPRPQDVAVLARLRNGAHVMIGAPATVEGATALYTLLDEHQTGYYRDRRGRLRFDGKRAHRHTIFGSEVAFYRMRQGTHEFGKIDQVPVNRVAGFRAGRVNPGQPGH
jgi:hypothetical protein